MKKVLGVLLVLCVAAPAVGEVQLDLSSGFNMDVICGALEFQAVMNYMVAYDPDKDLMELQGSLAQGVGWYATAQGTLMVCATSAGGFGQPYSTSANWWHPGYKTDAQALPEDGVITGASHTYHIASHTGNATYAGDWTEVANPTAGPPESIPNMAVNYNAMHVQSSHSTATFQIISTTATLPVAQQGQYGVINLVLGAAGAADGARNMRIVAIYSDASEDILYSFSTVNEAVGPRIDDSAADVYNAADFNVIETFEQMYNNGSGATGGVSADAGSLFEFAADLTLDINKTLVGIRVEDTNPSLNWNARGITIMGATADIPEPATMALLGLGVVGLVLRRRKK